MHPLDADSVARGALTTLGSRHATPRDAKRDSPDGIGDIHVGRRPQLRYRQGR